MFVFKTKMLTEMQVLISKYEYLQYYNYLLSIPQDRNYLIWLHVIFETHHRRKNRFHSLFWVAAFFWSEQQVDPLDVRTFPQDLLDQNFAEKSRSAGNEYRLADKTLGDAVRQVAELLWQHRWLVVCKIVLERRHF